MQSLYLKEPKLVFAEGNLCADPKLGLALYGPAVPRETSEVYPINIGIIGTSQGVQQTKLLLKQLDSPLPAKYAGVKGVKEVPFPGLNRPYGIKLRPVITEGSIHTISSHVISSLEETQETRERILIYFQACTHGLDVFRDAHPEPQVILIPLDEKIERLCGSGEKLDLKYADRVPNTPVEKLYDFHHAIKVEAQIRGYRTQVVKSRTLRFGGIQKRSQDPATIAWNLSTALYYKGTGLPWKLADVEADTCFAGIGFYWEPDEGEWSLQACLAMVYYRTGDSQIVRSNPFRWDGDDFHREPKLEADQMGEVIERIIGVYADRWQHPPARLVIHKSSSFTISEVLGVDQVLQKYDVSLCDLLHLRDCEFRGYIRDMSNPRVGHPYPPVRGTLINLDVTGRIVASYLLWVSGYIPSLKTYIGPRSPVPTRVDAYRLDSSLELSAYEILALSKLNWNNCNFNDHKPITLAGARNIGPILAEYRGRGIEPPPDYSYYM